MWRSSCPCDAGEGGRIPRTRLPAIEAACAQLGLPLDAVGFHAGGPVANPEAVLGGYDLVFAKARCALEAMAVGCAVVLCDVGGLGPLVTRAQVQHLRRWNFGRRTRLRRAPVLGRSLFLTKRAAPRVVRRD